MKREETVKVKDRRGEKGAAMVMVLLISMLLLTASAGLLMETTMNTANVTDATAEQQAYNAAESGIQTAINVLRGNTVPNPLIDASKPSTHPANRIDFRKAVTLTASNKNTDSGTKARLSRWMTYNYATGGGLDMDRITLGSGSYNPQSGYAYSVTVTDPDETGVYISYNTTGGIYDPVTATWRTSITFGTSPNTATITYIAPLPKNNLNVSGGSANTDYGRFWITVPSGSAGATMPEDLRFQITVNMTAPYSASRVMRGWLTAGTITSTSVGNVKFDFDSPSYEIMGSTTTLSNDPLIPNAPNTNFGLTTVNGNVTQAEPYRVIVRSVGYGPRGARKELEATVQKNFFNGLSAPATLTLIGDTNGFVFNAGSSQNVTYSGDDVVTSVIIPPLGTTNDTNLDSVFSTLNGRSRKADIVGYPANVTSEMPFWLQSPQNLDATIQSLKAVAKASGRYYASGQSPPNFGNNANATGITFIDGNGSLSGNGGGILICTGKLTLNGGVDFNGLIIVTGAGGVDRHGGGNGILQGNTVIAPYDPDNLNAGFLGPKYDISGGGTSEIVYNSSSVANGMTAVSNFVLGVAEK